MKIEIAKTDPRAQIPTRATDGAAGYDLYALILEDGNEIMYSIPPGDRRKIGTGLIMAIPTGYAGFVYSRSGMSHDDGLRLSNCVGVDDSDYRGELKVSLYNDSSETRIIKTGDRIGQIVFKKVEDADFLLVKPEQLSSTERGAGGFGSTGH